jgi:coproporphyrinogen III oxidase-like Fe-S oxidoreductase
MMGLRLTEGIDAEGFRARTGTTLADALDAAGLEEMRQLDLVEWDGERLRLSSKGQPLLNAVLAKLAA